MGQPVQSNPKRTYPIGISGGLVICRMGEENGEGGGEGRKKKAGASECSMDQITVRTPPATSGCVEFKFLLSSRCDGNGGAENWRPATA